jgi:hypothetical protein
VDVSFTDPIAQSVRNEYTRPLFAAHKRAKAKHKKYGKSAKLLNSKVVAFIIEGYGATNEEADSLIQKIDHASEGNANEQDFFNRIAVNLCYDNFTIVNDMNIAASKFHPPSKRRVWRAKAVQTPPPVPLSPPQSISPIDNPTQPPTPTQTCDSSSGRSISPVPSKHATKRKALSYTPTILQTYTQPTNPSDVTKMKPILSPPSILSSANSIISSPCHSGSSRASALMIDSPQPTLSPISILEPSQTMPKPPTPPSRSYAQAAAAHLKPASPSSRINVMENSTKTMCGILSTLQLFLNSRKFKTAFLDLAPLITKQEHSIFTDKLSPNKTDIIAEVINAHHLLNSGTTDYAPNVLTALLYPEEDPLRPKIQHDAADAFGIIFDAAVTIAKVIHEAPHNKFPRVYTEQKTEEFRKLAQTFLTSIAITRTDTVSYQLPNSRHPTSKPPQLLTEHGPLLIPSPLPPTIDEAIQDALKRRSSIFSDYKVTYKGKDIRVNSTITEQYDVKNLPTTLILNINRSLPSTFNTSSLAPSKDSSTIRFKPTLQVGERTYLLTQILVHWGASSDRGHYSSFIKNDSTARACNKWTHHNDSLSQPMNFTEVLRFCTKEPGKAVSLFVYEQLL